MQASHITLSGTMTHVPLSGGFWGILGEDGNHYRPVSPLPKEICKEGLNVRFEFSREERMSIFMWGKGIRIHEIKPV